MHLEEMRNKERGGSWGNLEQENAGLFYVEYIFIFLSMKDTVTSFYIK